MTDFVPLLASCKKVSVVPVGLVVKNGWKILSPVPAAPAVVFENFRSM